MYAALASGDESLRPEVRRRLGGGNLDHEIAMLDEIVAAKAGALAGPLPESLPDLDLVSGQLPPPSWPGSSRRSSASRGAEAFASDAGDSRSRRARWTRPRPPTSRVSSCPTSTTCPPSCAQMAVMHNSLLLSLANERTKPHVKTRWSEIGWDHMTAEHGARSEHTCAASGPSSGDRADPRRRGPAPRGRRTAGRARVLPDGRGVRGEAGRSHVRGAERARARRARETVELGGGRAHRARDRPRPPPQPGRIPGDEGLEERGRRADRLAGQSLAHVRAALATLPQTLESAQGSSARSLDARCGGVASLLLVGEDARARAADADVLGALASTSWVRAELRRREGKPEEAIELANAVRGVGGGQRTRAGGDMSGPSP